MGWWVVGEKKTKLMLYSTLVKVEVGVELGNTNWNYLSNLPASDQNFLQNIFFICTKEVKPKAD